MALRLPITILLVSTTQVFANENKTGNGTNAEAHNNNTIDIVPRRSSYGHIKFEGQVTPTPLDDTGGPNTYGGVVTFEDRPSNHPFRFEDGDKELAKPPIDLQESVSNNQGYGGFNPTGNQDVNIDASHLAGSAVQDIDNNPQGQSEYGLVFQDNNRLESNQKEQGKSGYGLVFQDDNRLEGNQNQREPGEKKKRRRRRRKPKQLAGLGYGFTPPGVGAARPGPPVYPGPLPGGQFYRPIRRPRPSYAEEALTSITTALTSIARYDDLQCVPRLLCEVAGGQNPVTGATNTGANTGTNGGSTSGLLQTVVNLQPLVTLLAAYNGVSTSPLFVFGRAALLGMTSKGSAGNCRYAYPQCPTDPEKLVEYLNNHNGGFFRFFNNPQPYGQQNLEQFYSQLSGSYGLYQPPGDLNLGPGIGYPNQGGYYNPNVGGLGPNQLPQLPGPNAAEGLGYPGTNQGYGFPNPVQFTGQYPNQIGGAGYPNPSLYQDFKYPVNEKYGLYQGQQNYGIGYPYKQGHFKNAVQDGVGKNKIEKRIQNRPDITYVGGNQQEFNENTKWTFPESNKNENVKNKQRFGRTILFPEKEYTSPLPIYENPHIETTYVQQNVDSNKKAKGFNFPETQSNRQYIDYYDYPPYTQILDNNNFKLDEQGFYIESNEETEYDYDQDNRANKENKDGVELVYVLRGNGDPNRPEIVKLKPGQKLQF